MESAAPTAVSSLQPGFPGSHLDRTIPVNGLEQKRYLFIVSREVQAPVNGMFAAMRRDMRSASVALVIDRRVGERRSREANVDDDRRSTSDRRRLDDPKTQFDAVGWARLEID